MKSKLSGSGQNMANGKSSASKSSASNANNKSPSLSSSSSSSNHEHIFKKYLNDLRNLTVGRKSASKLDHDHDRDEDELRRASEEEDDDDDDKPNVSRNRSSGHRGHRPIINLHDDDLDEDENEYDDEDEEEEEDEEEDEDDEWLFGKREVLDEKLREHTKSQIPWHNLDVKSAQLLVATFLDKTPTDLVSSSSSFYSRKGNKISSNQVVNCLTSSFFSRDQIE